MMMAQIYLLSWHPTQGDKIRLFLLELGKVILFYLISWPIAEPSKKKKILSSFGVKFRGRIIKKGLLVLSDLKRGLTTKKSLETLMSGSKIFLIWKSKPLKISFLFLYGPSPRCIVKLIAIINFNFSWHFIYMFYNFRVKFHDGFKYERRALFFRV